jgi:uncharacterized membrane protein
MASLFLFTLNFFLLISSWYSAKRQFQAQKKSEPTSLFFQSMLLSKTYTFYNDNESKRLNRARTCSPSRRYHHN